MNILITGNRGYVGPTLVRQAKAAGHRVVGLDVGFFESSGDGPSSDIPVDAQIWRDVRDVGPEDLDGVEAVIHLAALSNDVLGQLHPRLTRAINVEATMRLATLARTAGVERFVFASSCAVYGAADAAAAALDETAPLNPLSEYAASKVAGEAGLGRLADGAFTPVFLRFGTAFGVSPRTRFDLVVNNLAGWAHATGEARLTSDGAAWRPIVHIEDMAQAFLAALAAAPEAVSAQAFNVGHPGANHRVREIAEAVCSAFPGSKLVIAGEAHVDPRSYRVSFDKALSGLPGFAPRHTLASGAEEAARFLRDGGLRGRPFDSRFFIRLAQLEHAQACGELNADLRRDLAVHGPEVRP